MGDCKWWEFLASSILAVVRLSGFSLDGPGDAKPRLVVVADVPSYGVWNGPIVTSLACLMGDDTWGEVSTQRGRIWG